MEKPLNLHKSKMAAKYLESLISLLIYKSDLSDLKFNFGIMGHQESVKIHYHSTGKLFNDKSSKWLPNYKM